MSRVFLLVFVMIISLASVASAGVSVSSDSKYFDIASSSFVLEGHVLVQTDTRTIGADKARVNLLTKEVWADGNIYLNQEDDNIKFTGGNLYASDESKTAVIKGNVTFERPDITIKAVSCSFNWSTKIAEFSGLVEVQEKGKIKSYDIVLYNIEDNKIIDAK